MDAFKLLSGIVVAMFGRKSQLVSTADMYSKSRRLVYFHYLSSRCTFQTITNAALSVKYLHM